MLLYTTDRWKTKPGLIIPNQGGKYFVTLNSRIKRNFFHNNCLQDRASVRSHNQLLVVQNYVINFIKNKVPVKYPKKNRTRVIAKQDFPLDGEKDIVAKPIS